MSIKKIAQMTGLSIATVSHALNRNRPVSDESREKVMAAAKEIGYRPNVAARVLRTQRSNTIAFVIPTDEANTNANFFYMDVLLGIRKKLWETGYDVIVSNYSISQPGESERSLRALQVCQKQWVDGILFVPSSENANQLNVLRETNVPFVLLDRRVAGAGYSCVDSDNESGAFQSVSLLSQSGRRRIGFIGGMSAVSSGAQRYEGYKRALDACGRPYREEYVIREKVFSVEKGRECALALLERGVDGLFVADNTLTLGAMKALKERGIRIPADVGIIGFDDFAWMELTTPTLTAVKQQSYQMGYVAAEMIMRKLNGMDINESIKLATEVVVRGSH